MNMSLIQIIAAIAMAGTAVALVLGFWQYLGANSERRMRMMLESVGLNPEIAMSGEIPTIMKEVRQRCQHCATEDVCERWLKGNEEGDNAFCPNANVFEALKKYSRAA
ncbi:MAG: DUF6455 family protein [Gammaproteobacteria bacterium]|jgi:PP-loop superfamily ATP-utilizing enzyme|nr:DUF6455 family protein [Gammaproteobacteria bacterium]